MWYNVFVVVFCEMLATIVSCGGRSPVLDAIAETGGAAPCETATGSGGMGGAGGSGGTSSAGGGGAAPADRCETATGEWGVWTCAGSASPWPPPPAAPTGERIELAAPIGLCFGGATTLLSPASAHSMLPEVMPSIAVATYPAGDPSDITIEASAEDGSGSVAEYETPHQISASMPGLGKVAYPEIGFATIITTESGAGSIPGGTFSNVLCIVR